jgi:hypothetical protein
MVLPYSQPSPGNSADTRRQLLRLAVRHGQSSMLHISRLILWGVASVVIIGSVMVYVEVLSAINGQAPIAAKRSGWLAIIQPASNLDSPRIGPVGNSYTLQKPDEVGLDVTSSAVGPHPWTSYTVKVCGTHQYTGALLLLGGGARLSLIGSSASAPNTTVHVRTARTLILSVHNVFEARFNSVQIIQLYLPAVHPCSATPVSGSFATSYSLSGSQYGSIEQPWERAWDFWSSPQLSQVWPSTGAIPGIPASFFGPISATKGINGSWDFPLNESIRVDSPPIALSSSVDTASPALPSGTRDLDWTSRTGPISPTAIITDTAETATLETVLGLAGVVAGAAVALALTLLVDALKRPVLRIIRGRRRS